MTPEPDWEAELEKLIQDEKVRAKPGGVGVIVTPVREAEDLAALLGLGGVDADVVAAETGALVWFALPEQEFDEFDALLGDDRPVPPEVDAVARKVSAIIAPSVVVCVSWLEEGDVEPGVSGQITARRYTRGEPGDALPAGLLLSTQAPVVEDLLLGRVNPADLADGERARSQGRLAALTHFGRMLRRKGQ